MTLNSNLQKREVLSIKDMLNQMKNVRDIPVSQSGANSQPESANQTDGVFDVLKGIDGGLDDMFG